MTAIAVGAVLGLIFAWLWVWWMHDEEWTGPK